MALNFVCLPAACFAGIGATLAACLLFKKKEPCDMAAKQLTDNKMYVNIQNSLFKSQQKSLNSNIKDIDRKLGPLKKQEAEQTTTLKEIATQMAEGDVPAKKA